MTRQEIINKVKKYFDIRELVCPHTFNKWGEKSWQFLVTNQLETILFTRELLKVGMTCNNYHIGGSRTESGLRCNICSIPKGNTMKNNSYLSAHCLGAGNDFVFSNITAEEAREIIRKNVHLYPHPIRLEKGVSWLHIDSYDTGNGQKLVEFSE